MMKRFIPLNQLFDKFESKGINTWLDKLTFLHIFSIWASIIVIFGLSYYFFAGSSYFIYDTINKLPLSKVQDAIYFSFIASTTAGFGDFVPKGLFKLVSIFEIIAGVLLIAVVTSKLVSFKQDIILNEIYDISFNEKINRLRSSLLLFRQNLSKIIDKVEENTIRKREVNDAYIYLVSLEDILNEILSLMGTSGKHYFKKVIDPLNTELLFNSVLRSFERLNELIGLLNQNKIEWKRDIILSLIDRTISLNDSLFAKLSSSKNLPDKTISSLASQKDEIIGNIRQGLK